MSHTTKVQVQFKDSKALRDACNALKIPFQEGPFTVSFYDGQKHEGNIKVTLPGWTYPVLFNSQTGDVAYDNYEGKWGDIRQLHNLVQEYALQVAEDQASELKLQGWTIERVPQANGDIQLVLTQ